MATRDIYATTVDEDVQDETRSNHCSECGGQITTNTVETICEKCGLIIDEQQIDRGPEWRACDRDERKRTGASLTAARHDRGLSTEIGRGADANGNALTGRKRRQLARMRREHSRGRFRSKAERDLARVEHWRVRNAYKTMNAELGLPAKPVVPSEFVPRLASELEVPDKIRHRARELAERADSAGITTGVRPSGFAASCLYKSGCEDGWCLTQSAVAEAANVSATTVRSHRDALDELIV